MTRQNSPRRSVSPRLLAALEYGPIVIFFAAFILAGDAQVSLWGHEYGGVVLATLAFVPVSILAAAVTLKLTGHLAPMQIITLAMVVLLGGFSIWLNDPRFIKMKPTFVYLTFAGLLGFAWLSRRNWLEQVLGAKIPMKTEGWHIFTGRIVLLFLILAALNEIVWRNFSDGFWLTFKLAGLPVLLAIGMMLSAPLFKLYEKVESDSTEERDR